MSKYKRIHGTSKNVRRVGRIDIPGGGQVSVVDNRFNPSANIVQPGDTVTWTWGGDNLHNVTFDDAMIGNSTTQTSGTFTKAFAAVGEFTYYCAVHGKSVMSGRVVVGEASSGSNGTSY